MRSKPQRPMFSHTESCSPFIVPLGQEAHEVAEQLCQRHSDWQKAEQVYLNSLAIYAVDYYLRCLGYRTDWKNSDSYNAITQALLDVTDLIIPDYGRLECRRVLPGSKTAYVPAEVWHDRLGYVAVCLNEALDVAEILGFFQQAHVFELPLSQLSPLNHLPSYLETHRRSEPTGEPVDLSQWLKNVFTASWHSVEEVIAAGHSELALQFRGDRGAKAGAGAADMLVASVTRTKVIELGSPDPSVLVLITLKAEQLADQPDGAIHIQIEILPVQGQPFLPVGLQLSVLNRQGEAVMQTQTQETQDGVRLEFTADPDEQFSIKISLSNVAIVEEFLV
jgi:hypothetical protein